MGGTASASLASASAAVAPAVPAPPTSGITAFSVITLIFLVGGLVAIYYLYRFLYTSSSDKFTPILTKQRPADDSPRNVPTIPTPYEGGDYSVNMWVYISSFNKNRNTRKHLFELQGQYFSTLLVGLGAFNNTLMVRTHTQDPSSEGFQDTRKAHKVIEASEGFQAGSGTGSGMPMVVSSNSSGPGSGAGSGSGPGPGSVPAAAPKPSSTPTHSAVPPNAGTSVGNLSSMSVDSLFTPLAMDDALLNAPPMCDLPEIGMQRWTMITVVLSGRTIDVYLDGKLNRSCIAPSYFKVDPTGVTANITDRGGFDGYTGYTAVSNYAMNPDEIYRAYMSGPNGLSATDIFSWFTGLFKGSS